MYNSIFLRFLYFLNYFKFLPDFFIHEFTNSEKIFYYIYLSNKAIMEPSIMYLRIKREKRVLFFECYPTDIVEVLKKKLLNFYKQDINEMRLFYGTRVNNVFYF